MKNKINVMILIGCLIATGTLSAVFAFPAKTPKQRLNEIHKLLPKTFDNGNFSLVLSLEFEAGYIIENYQLEKSDAFASICFGIGKRFMRSNNYPCALIWFQRSIDLVPKERNLSLVFPLLTMGFIYNEQSEYKLSNEKSFKVLELIKTYRHKKYFKKEVPDYYSSAAFFQIAKNEDGLTNYSNALQYYDEALKECDNIDDNEIKHQFISNILMHIGDSYRKAKNYASTEKYYGKALSELEKTKDDEYIIRKKSQIYYRLAYSSYLQKNSIKVKEYLSCIPDENSLDNDNLKLSEKIVALYKLP